MADMKIENRPKFARIPRHVGLIPDGNRRWAKNRDLPAELGYAAGLAKGIEMLDEMIDIGVEEVSAYGFTQDNNKRPTEQRQEFTCAVIGFVEAAMERDLSLRVIGDHTSECFPRELKPYALSRQGSGKLKFNLLVNYGWNWDLQHAIVQGRDQTRIQVQELLASKDVSRIDLIVRWGGTRRLSGFLPVQSVYADFYVVDELWPDCSAQDFYTALEWYQKQDVTLGG